MVSTKLLQEKLNEATENIISWKNYFHENPELSMQEKMTSQAILDVVNKFNLPYEMVGEYGIIARLETGKPGKTVLLRADMDALPVLEDTNNLKSAKCAVSKNAGVSHACGHDAHMAILLGAMQVLCNIKDQLAGTVLFVFEQAEEVGGGILPMLKALGKYQVDTCYGTHIYAGLESGKICVAPGERMAAITSFAIKVKGQGGHGSRPDLTINPIMCAVQIISNLNQIWTNELDPTKTVTLGIGYFKGGEKGNVIPDEASFSGTMRYYDIVEGKKAFAAVKRVAEAIAVAHRCEIEYERILQSDAPVVNDEFCSEVAEKGIAEILGEETLKYCDPWFATESMGYYFQKAKGVFAFLGIDDKENGYGSGHHTKEFDMDNSVLVKGTAACVKYTVDSLAL